MAKKSSKKKYNKEPNPLCVPKEERSLRGIVIYVITLLRTMIMVSTLDIRLVSLLFVADDRQPPESRFSARNCNTEPETDTEINTPDTKNPNSDGGSGSSDVPSFVNTLNDILAGKYDHDRVLIKKLMDEAFEQAEKDGRTEEMDEKFMQVANHRRT